MVRFSTTGTYFSPTCQDIRDMLDRLMDNMINSVGNVNRVSYLSNKAAMNTGPNIQSMVRENKQFLSVAESIQQRVVSDFEKAEEHAQSYESFKQIYDFNVAWDFEAYRAQQHDSSSLKVTLELIGNWSKDLEKLRNKPIGILEVDSKRLKGELNPLREARLQEIKDYIKDIARIRCSQLLDSYKDNLIKLSSKPTHLKEFANQVQTIVTLKEDEKSLYKKTSQVITMHPTEQRFLIYFLKTCRWISFITCCVNTKLKYRPRTLSFMRTYMNANRSIVGRSRLHRRTETARCLRWWWQWKETS